MKPGAGMFILVIQYKKLHLWHKLHQEWNTWRISFKLDFYCSQPDEIIHIQIL